MSSVKLAFWRFGRQLGFRSRVITAEMRAFLNTCILCIIESWFWKDAFSKNIICFFVWAWVPYEIRWVASSFEQLQCRVYDAIEKDSYKISCAKATCLPVSMSFVGFQLASCIFLNLCMNLGPVWRPLSCKTSFDKSFFAGMSSVIARCWKFSRLRGCGVRMRSVEMRVFLNTCTVGRIQQHFWRMPQIKMHLGVFRSAWFLLRPERRRITKLSVLQTYKTILIAKPIWQRPSFWRSPKQQRSRSSPISTLLETRPRP